jgi:hypothetical protein
MDPNEIAELKTKSEIKVLSIKNDEISRVLVSTMLSPSFYDISGWPELPVKKLSDALVKEDIETLYRAGISYQKALELANEWFLENKPSKKEDE